MGTSHARVPRTERYHSTLLYDHSLRRDQRFKLVEGPGFGSPLPTTRQKFALCLGWVKVSVQSHEGAAALARRGALGGACSSLGCPLAQLPGLCPSQKPVPSHHFPKQKLSRSSAARFERVKHAFVCSLVILNSWVRAAHSPRP